MIQHIVAVANLIFLGFMAWMIWRKQSSLKNLYWPTLLFKVGAGIALGVVYTYYYTIADTLAYHEDGTKLSNLARTDFASYLRFFNEAGEQYSFWHRLNFKTPRALFLSKITSVFCLLTSDNYWVISAYYSFFSFLAAWYLMKILIRLDESLKIPAIVALLLFPSIVFWTSGIMKETIAMASLYFISIIFLKIWLGERVKIAQWIVLPVACWLLWNLKYYYMAILLPVLATALMFNLFVFPYLKLKGLLVRIVLWIVIFLVPLYVASLIHPNFYPERFLTVVVDNYYDFLELSSPSDVAHFDGLEPTVTSLLIHAPKALTAALYRPWPWEVDGIFKVLAAAENVMLLLLTIGAITNWKQVVSSQHRVLLVSVIIYVVTLAIFLALSAPNFGTLIRYRVGFLPFFVMIISVNNPIISRTLAFMERTFPFLGRLTR
ncbi:hypothetical protein [Pseudochryseolinea flava]|uniref:Glycosyltransferase RgtA/B/C/D-like domain-containing protein n=1 Tax=Pseudochryseolinea flava TaxID=2059302 RepID=A0A364Y4U3_9BACT|nr:hypothetical protein [Pseudochryseolinea flava]RAW01061.1 hypothetical protein DQQ10_12590 [Pseudochryseolinea flava]